jgi:FKBP-type peptidyl-prolyl cis-trans isomerase FkpA
MNRPSLIVLLAASALMAACGSASTNTSGAPHQPAQAPAPSTEAPAPVTHLAAPPEKKLDTTATVPTPDTGAAKTPAPAGVRRAARRRVPSPEHPTFSQTDLEIGTGAAAASGRRLTVNYTGWLYDPAEPEQKGRQFDSSVGGQPFEFVLGARRVIRGWDQGFDGMKVGGKRRLVIPPELGYGERGFGNGIIPPNAALVFEMELIDVREQ